MSDRTLNNMRESSLLESIAARRCVLFLGPDAATGPGGNTLEQELTEIARVTLAKSMPGPLPQNASFHHLCQLAGAARLDDIREDVTYHFRKLRADGATSPGHESFARMPFPLIVQLTPDPYMANAITGAGDLCVERQYDFRQNQVPPPFPDLSDEKQRLLYGLRGLWTAPQSIPLSTDEDVSHLVALVREQPRMPEALTAALRGTGTDQRSALFVGFDFAAWQTRMLLHGLFAIAPSNIVKPVPAVATLAALHPPGGGGPAEEDREFLWSCYRIIFTQEPTSEFAKRLENALSIRKPPASAPGIDRGALRRFMVELPDEVLNNLAFDEEEFSVETAEPWKAWTRSQRVSELLRWMDGRHRLAVLLDRIEKEAPALLEKSRDTLRKSP